MDNIFPYWIIFLLPFCLFGQTTADSYKNLWEVIQNDAVSNEKKVQYLDIYYQKARAENNQLEQYRALEKKSFIVPFANATALLHQMHPLVQKMDNDSIKGGFLNRSTVFYYDNRDFKNALYYAIESEVFNEEVNNLYNLNAVRIDIGNIYHHTRHYSKAIAYFAQAKNYYQTKKDYNHLRGYINTLYNLGGAYWQLKDIDKLNATIQESEQAIKLLKPKDKQLETAYLEYIKGGLAFLQKNDVVAQQYFTNALNVIKQNGDFTNEHVIYLYLGKIAWQQNQKAEAIEYFTKIDELFHEKKFLNYELREAYDYLIAYYKETQQPQKQIQATESLIALNRQFEKEQQHLTNTLHYELETKKLEASKTDLVKQLDNSKNTLALWVILGGLLCLALVIYGISQNKQKKQWRLYYNNLMNEAEEALVPTPKVVEILPEETGSKNRAVTQDASVKQEHKLSVTELRLLQDLQTFEQEKGFLKPLKIDDFAAQLNTNRNTLSKLINTHKNVNFNQYINNLRVKQLLIDFKKDPLLRKLSMQVLAETYGFANAKTFTTQFKTETKVPPAFFIEQLELDDLEKSKQTSNSL